MLLNVVKNRKNRRKYFVKKKKKCPKKKRKKNLGKKMTPRKRVITPKGAQICPQIALFMFCRWR